MNIPLLIFAIVGVSVIFYAAAWFGPKLIRAIYPEQMHERMITLHRRMVIVAIIMGILGIFAGAMPFILANQT